MDHRWTFPWRGVARIGLIVSTFVFAVLFYPVWNHHDVRLESPVFSTAAGAAAWIRQQPVKGPAHTCVPATVDTKTVTLAEEEGIFVLYKCNTSTIYTKFAALFIVPFAIVILLAILAFRR